MTVALRNVVKLAGAETHVHRTNISLAEGEFNVLLGATLSGKTTLLRLMAGLERPSQGQVWFKGKDVTGVPVRKRKIAMVYQEFVNYPNLSVYDNIASPLSVTRMPRREIGVQVHKVAEMLSILPLLERMPVELSGGQQQRVALARALVKRADLVLLDEPLANLDYKLREELREELPTLFKDSGSTVIYATTEPREALLLGGYTATLHEGRITQFGPASSVYREPADLESARAFTYPRLNTARINKLGTSFYYDGVSRWEAQAPYASLPDGPYTIGIRPHHIVLTSDDESAGGVKGTVVATEISGSESLIRVEVGTEIWLSLTRGAHALRRGDTVRLHIQTDRCVYFDENDQLIQAS